MENGLRLFHLIVIPLFASLIMTAKFQLKKHQRDSYWECIQTFPLTSIQSEPHFRAAQAMLVQLVRKNALDEGETLYLDALTDLIATYEDAHVPIPPASDKDMLRHLLDSQGLTPAQLSRAAGLPKSSISEVLAGKKPFSRQMIRKLADYFKVDVGVLVGNL